jgi:DNA-binding transcriptional MerR regulator
MNKSADAFRTISEVADDLDLPQHVLRFWETRFPQIRPLKRAGGRRFYRPADVLLLKAIRQLLYGEGYTIKGVQRLLKEQGAKAIQTGPMPSGGASLNCGNGDDTPDEDDQALEAFASAEAGIAAESEIPDSLRAVLDIIPPSGGQPRLPPEDRDALKAALGTILECERILRATRRPSP